MQTLKGHQTENGLVYIVTRIRRNSEKRDLNIHVLCSLLIMINK